MRKRAFRVANGTLTSVIRQYLDSEKFLVLSEASKVFYRRVLINVTNDPELGAMRVESIRPSHIQRYLDKFLSRPYTQTITRSILKSLEKWAIARDKLPHAIMTGTTAQPGTGGHLPWREEQIALAEKHTSPQVSKFITLASNTGQRGSDLVKMKWTDIEVVDGHPGIHVTQLKTKLELWIPFTDELSAAMASWDRSLGYLVTKADGTPFTRTRLTHKWDWERDHWPALEPLRDPPMKLHGLRATAVVRLRRLGLSDPLIGDTVGMSPQMVKRYSRFSKQRENAMAAIRLINRTAAERKGGLP